MDSLTQRDDYKTREGIKKYITKAPHTMKATTKNELTKAEPRQQPQQWGGGDIYISMYEY